MATVFVGRPLSLSVGCTLAIFQPNLRFSAIAASVDDRAECSDCELRLLNGETVLRRFSVGDFGVPFLSLDC
jgi:hypothetical protein